VVKENILKEFTKAVFHMGLGQFSGLFFGLVTVSVLARGLGPEGRGTLAMVLLLPLTVSKMLNMSLNSAVIHYVAKEKDRVAEIVGTSIRINVILAVLQCIVTAAITCLAGKFLIIGIDYNLVYLAAILAMISSIAFGVAPSVLIGLQEFKYQGYLTLFTSPFIPLGYLLLVYYGHLTIFSVIITKFILEGIVGGITLKRVLQKVGKLEFAYHSWTKKFFIYGGFCHLSNVITFFNYRLDMYLLNYFKGMGPTGMYGSAVGISERLWMLSRIASGVIFPKISAMNDEKQKQRLTLHACGGVLIVTGFGAVVLWLIAPFFVPLLLGPEFTDSIGAVRWLLPGIVALSAGRVLSNDLAGRDKTHLNTASAALMLLSNVVLNIFLIPRYGINGAAIATSISYTFGFILIYMFYKNVLSHNENATSRL